MAAQSLTLVAVVGPTASGKTALGLELARRLGGELVSADSRQMYRTLEAGTAKPRGRWESGPDGARRFLVDGVAIHLTDVLEPSERVDAGRFAALAGAAVADIRARGRRPILVGGAGLYLRAFLEGLDPLPPRDEKIRESLAELAEANGRHWLHEELERVDPEAARRIPANNIHRVVRALEVYRLTGRPISSMWSAGSGSTAEPDRRGGASGIARAAAAGSAAGAGSSPEGDRPRRVSGDASAAGAPSRETAAYVGLRWPRAALHERIRLRCEAMFPAILEETARLVPARYTGREPGFQSLGYPEALRCLSGELSPERGLASFIRSTCDYAKRQATWFTRQVPARWIDAEGGEPSQWADAAIALLEAGATR